MVVSDVVLDTLLSVIGIHIYPKRLLIKMFAFFIVTFYCSSMIHFVVAASISLPFKIRVLSLSFAVVSMLIWFMLFLRRKQISAIIHELYRYRKRYNVSKNASNYIQSLIAILCLLCFIVFQAMNHVDDDPSSDDNIKFWSFGYMIYSKVSMLAFKIYINSAYFALSSFPVLLTFIISVIMYKWAETLKAYKRSLEIHLRSIKNKKMFIDYLKMTKILRELNQVFNIPLFCIILYSLFDIFMALYEIMKMETYNYTIILSNFMTISYGIMMVVMYSVCSSMISESLVEIKLTVRKQINEHVFGVKPLISQNVLLYLRRIETEEIIYITVCGVFRLTRSFILSAIGSILTYDLLIINTIENTPLEYTANAGSDNTITTTVISHV